MLLKYLTVLFLLGFADKSIMTKQAPILYLTRTFPPTHAAAGIRAERFVSALVNAGYSVTVITAGKSAELKQQSSSLTVCRIGPDGSLPDQITKDHLPIWPWWKIPVGPEPDKLFTRAAYQAAHFFAKNQLLQMTFVSGPPFSIMPIGLQLKELYHIPLVLDFRDAWFTAMPWPYRNALQRRQAQRFERLCLERADSVITATETLKKHLVDKYQGNLSDKTITIRHGFDSSLTSEENPKEDLPTLPNSVRPFTITYTGQLHGVDIASATTLQKPMQSLGRFLRKVTLGAKFCDDLILEWMSPHILLDAVAKSCSANDQFKNNVRLIFVGQRYPQIDLWVTEHNLTGHVFQLGQLPPPTAHSIAQQSDLLVLTLYGIKNCDYHWCVPSKIYSYLGTGNPILAMLPPGEALDLVNQSGLGFPAAPDNATEISIALLDRYNSIANGTAAVEPDWNFINQFTADKQQALLVNTINSILK